MVDLTENSHFVEDLVDSSSVSELGSLDCSDGSVVVLVHGFAGEGIVTWQFQVGALTKKYDVYVPDLLFFGGSFSDKPDRSPTFQAECLAAGLKKLGVEDYPASKTETESVAEKRQRLLGALQKCDEDLKALKKIIEAVRCTDQLRTPSPAISNSADCFGGKIRTVSETNCSELKGEQQQQPSPVSVLDEFTRSALSPVSYSISNLYSNGAFASLWSLIYQSSSLN